MFIQSLFAYEASPPSPLTCFLKMTFCQRMQLGYQKQLPSPDGSQLWLLHSPPYCAWHIPAKAKYNCLFADILYKTCSIGVFRSQDADSVPFSCLTFLLVDKYNSMMTRADTSSYIRTIVLEYSYCFRRQNIPTLPLFYVNTHSIFIWKRYIGLNLTI